MSKEPSRAIRFTQIYGDDIQAYLKHTVFLEKPPRSSLILSGRSSSRARCSCIPRRTTSESFSDVSERSLAEQSDSSYLRFGERVVNDIVNRTRVDCGLAGILDLETGELEDRMHSFALSETLKYAYLIL